MDRVFIAKYIPLYQKAALLTVEIGVLGITVADTTVFHLLWVAKNRDTHRCTNMRYSWSCVSWRQLYGGGFSKRRRSNRYHSGRKCIQPGA